ncbi:MAG: NAD(P)H-dependent oxidoreductase [Alphaproteobacteria bacterium]|nr:NAD(P)H-dependent oxidoreductase [Alphaproteobacteria bacterium]
MAMTPKILAFSGSSRDGSYNGQLLEIAANGARAAGAEVTVVNLRKLRLPLFDEDFERLEGLPAGARELKDLMMANQGSLIACPEYNSSITPALKNAIDCASRPVVGEPPLACFDGKVAGIMSASPGGLGGLRGLVHVRAILSNIKVLVIPDQLAVGEAQHAFNTEGGLKNKGQQKIVEALGAKVAAFITKLAD